jgi:hypothetical protein
MLDHGHTADGGPVRFFPETGHSVSGPFLAFYEHYGSVLCGHPITGIVNENGRRCQYFQRLALEEHAPGRVRVKPLGEAWIAMRRASEMPTEGVPEPSVIDLTDRLPTHPTRRYATRSLDQVRYLVVHHTGAPAEVGPQEIAAEHVETNGWPGIGYHYVIDPEGVVFRTQDHTTVSHHARQFNPVAIGIALAGDLSDVLPPPAQLDRTADLAARLLVDLGLPPANVRGHREMVPTPCPGDLFLGVWRPRLAEAIAERLGASPPGRVGGAFPLQRGP